jgi:type II secretory pathway pseudopilin PulG
MRDHFSSQDGFSLVEMMVVLVFTMILMAGLATVFKASLSSFVVSGEKISSSRRNRMAMDLLSDDLNVAGQYLDLRALPGGIVDANPGFAINPKNRFPFTDTDIPAVDAVSDELVFFFDDPLPAEGTFVGNVSGLRSTLVSDGNYTPECTILFKDATAVTQGMRLVTRNNYEIQNVAAGGNPSGNSVGITTENAFMLDHPDKSSVLVYKPRQYVRYRIESQYLDPEKPTVGIPCLIRAQGPYPDAGTLAPDTTTIVAENVSGFTVSLSVDGGTTWRTGASWADITTLLDADLATHGPPGFKTVGSSPQWFRYVPVMLRVDVTTRTVKPRAEYSAAGNTLEYKKQVQSLILLPRHFGLNF